MTSTPTLTIRDFAPGDEAAFFRLNEAWVTRLFKMEPKDLYALQNPKEVYLDGGGRIFMGCLGEGTEPIGCCCLMRMSPGEFEVSKMTVTEAHAGAGIGRKLLVHTVEQARAMGARRLYLETNHTLSGAIHLYESVGFRHLKPEEVTPSPYARADVFMEMNLAE